MAISIESYQSAAPLIKEYASLILSPYSEFVMDPRSTIIRNFFARSVVSFGGLLTLWEAEDYHDCWIIYRALLDRFFHLESLGRDNSFEQFEAWCFVYRYEYKKRCLDDPTVRDKMDNIDDFTPSIDDDVRYLEIDKKSTRWRRPKALDIARELDVEFLYHYGYSFASSFVHPTATEGQEDFTRMTSIDTGKFADNQITVLHNSCLIVTMIFRAGLVYSQLMWRKPVFDFVNHLAAFIVGAPGNFMADLHKIRGMNERGIALCRVPDKPKP